MKTKSRTSVAAPPARHAVMLLLAACALSGLAACGQKGPLRLPERAAGAAPASAPAASTPGAAR